MQNGSPRWWMKDSNVKSSVENDFYVAMLPQIAFRQFEFPLSLRLIRRLGSDWTPDENLYKFVIDSPSANNSGRNVKGTSRS